MRTNKLLLTAVALVAAGIVSSQAQTVYSANVVGYVNQVIPGSSSTLICNPLLNDTNGANEVLTA